MGYQRELPRDLFNEAKLLKCLGRLTLLIHDEFCSLRFEHENKREGFTIEQGDSGDLSCTNLKFYDGETEIDLYTPLNSKANYPLFWYDDQDEMVDIFDFYSGELLQFTAQPV